MYVALKCPVFFFPAEHLIPRYWLPEADWSRWWAQAAYFLWEENGHRGGCWPSGWWVEGEMLHLLWYLLGSRYCFNFDSICMVKQTGTQQTLSDWSVVIKGGQCVAREAAELLTRCNQTTCLIETARLSQLHLESMELVKTWNKSTAIACLPL